MNNNNKISIIVAAHNAENFIRSSIQSVLQQTHPFWELLIIDDGSDDRTREIIDEYRDGRIRSFKQRNKGVSAARNVGLRYMTGKFFCFLDADDILPPGSLQSRLSVFGMDPEIVFVDGKIEFFQGSPAIIKGSWTPSFRGHPLPQLLSISGKCFAGCSWMIRRNEKKDYKFNEYLSHGEDLLFFISLATDGGIYEYTTDPVLYYRKGHPSAMKDLKGLEKGYRKIFRILNDVDRFNSSDVSVFGKKARKIIFKSYLGHFRPFQALLSLLRKW